MLFLFQVSEALMHSHGSPFSLNPKDPSAENCTNSHEYEPALGSANKGFSVR